MERDGYTIVSNMHEHWINHREKFEIPLGNTRSIYLNN